MNSGHEVKWTQVFTVCNILTFFFVPFFQLVIRFAVWEATRSSGKFPEGHVPSSPYALLTISHLLLETWPEVFLTSVQSVYQDKILLAVATIADVNMYWPTIWRTLFPTMSSALGAKHSTSVPSSAIVAIPRSVDSWRREFKSGVVDVALKVPPGPQVSLSSRPTMHSLPPPTLQMVSLEMTSTVHMKQKVSLGQVGGGAVNCPQISP